MSGRDQTIASPLDAIEPDPHAEWEAYAEKMDREQATAIGSITELVVCSSPLPPCRGEGWALVEERDGCSVWKREVYRRSEASNA